MNEEKFILVNLEDTKSKELAQVISSDTARKILNLLSEKPLSETDISQKLQIPLPTAHYNIKQLLKADIVEIKDFLWSEKGKKIQLYQLSNKLIIIAPKNSSSFTDKLKEILPVTLSGLLVSIGIYLYGLLIKNKTLFSPYNQESMMAPTTLTKIVSVNQSLNLYNNYALWFFLGVITLTAFYILISLVRTRKK